MNSSLKDLYDQNYQKLIESANKDSTYNASRDLLNYQTSRQPEISSEEGNRDPIAEQFSNDLQNYNPSDFLGKVPKFATNFGTGVGKGLGVNGLMYELSSIGTDASYEDYQKLLNARENDSLESKAAVIGGELYAPVGFGKAVGAASLVGSVSEALQPIVYGTFDYGKSVLQSVGLLPESATNAEVVSNLMGVSNDLLTSYAIGGPIAYTQDVILRQSDRQIDAGTAEGLQADLLAGLPSLWEGGAIAAGTTGVLHGLGYAAPEVGKIVRNAFKPTEIPEHTREQNLELEQLASDHLFQYSQGMSRERALGNEAIDQGFARGQIGITDPFALEQSEKNRQGYKDATNTIDKAFTLDRVMTKDEELEFKAALGYAHNMYIDPEFRTAAYSGTADFSEPEIKRKQAARLAQSLRQNGINISEQNIVNGVHAKGRQGLMDMAIDGTNGVSQANIDIDNEMSRIENVLKRELGVYTGFPTQDLSPSERRQLPDILSHVYVSNPKDIVDLYQSEFESKILEPIEAALKSPYSKEDTARTMMAHGSLAERKSFEFSPEEEENINRKIGSRTLQNNTVGKELGSVYRGFTDDILAVLRPNYSKYTQKSINELYDNVDKMDDDVEHIYRELQKSLKMDVPQQLTDVYNQAKSRLRGFLVNSYYWGDLGNVRAIVKESRNSEQEARRNINIALGNMSKKFPDFRLEEGEFEKNPSSYFNENAIGKLKTQGSKSSLNAREAFKDVPDYLNELASRVQKKIYALDSVVSIKKEESAFRNLPDFNGMDQKLFNMKEGLRDSADLMDSSIQDIKFINDLASNNFGSAFGGGKSFYQKLYEVHAQKLKAETTPTFHINGKSNLTEGAMGSIDLTTGNMRGAITAGTRISGNLLFKHGGTALRKYQRRVKGSGKYGLTEAAHFNAELAGKIEKNQSVLKDAVMKDVGKK